MKKNVTKFLLGIFFLISLFYSCGLVKAQMPNEAQPVPVKACVSGCPSNAVDQNCAANYDEWLSNRSMDFWVQDPEVVAIGQNGERARQFLWWIFNHNSLDNHPSLLAVWSLSRNITYFLLILATVLVGLGIIIGQRNNFNLKINLTNQIFKIALLLLYITFSATFVILLIQLSDVVMQFFIKTLGADKIFNIFFANNVDAGNYLASSEKGYRDIAATGCSNISLRAAESVRFSKILLMATNVTYFVIGIVFLLRKIILWFMLIASPFLAILIPFSLTKNVGAMWMGLFFQWLFYGPLFGLFIGGLATMWNSKNSIPFQFNFQRIGQDTSFVYPTAISISFNGPSIRALADVNPMISSNYVDTFVEYVIALLMLWVAVILPWFLLRSFRDNCCDGIESIKNILLSNIEGFKGGQNTPPPPSKLKAGAEMSRSMSTDMPFHVKIDNIEDLKKANTDDIKEAMGLSVSKISDIAAIDMNGGLKSEMSKNIDYLRNPMSASTPSERQQYMHLRTELFDRATKGDESARRTLAAITSNKFEQNAQKEELIKSLTTAGSSTTVSVPKEKIAASHTRIYENLINNEGFVNAVSSATNVAPVQTRAMLKSFAKPAEVAQTAENLIAKISKESTVESPKVREMLEKLNLIFTDKNQFTENLAKSENLPEDEVKEILLAYVPKFTEEKQNLEEKISLPQTVSIEEYEQIKNMWNNHYERGEVPISDTITNRREWINSDVVSITNILNKLLSPDVEVKKKALDEVSYILPIFLINNLKGDELMVYLKAKLEAAKQVKKIIEKENEVMEKKQEDEALVDVKVEDKKENENTLAMHLENPLPNDAA